jgi:hypothetical protein
MGIRRVTNEFITQGRDLLRRLRSTEGNMLTAVEVRALRVQLHLLDNELASKQYKNTPRMKKLFPEAR